MRAWRTLSLRRYALCSALLLVALLTACASQPPRAAESATTTEPAAQVQPSATAPAATATSPETAATAETPMAMATAATAESSPVPTTEAALREGQALLDLLARGGLVIFFRHAATDFSQTDTDRQNLQNCQTQRNLSEQGRSDARGIGQAFQALGIPVGQLLASPYCRTLETEPRSVVRPFG